MEYTVEIDITGKNPGLNQLGTGLLERSYTNRIGQVVHYHEQVKEMPVVVVGSVQTNVVQIDYARLKSLLDRDLKHRWNVPVQQEMIRVGRRLAPEQFPGDSVKLSLLPQIANAIDEREADLERAEDKKEDLREFRRLYDQERTDVVPGHLAFWVELEKGSLNKWDSSTEREVGITDGSGWAKILYVLVPNWQLFWLSDSMNPKAEELGETRFKTKYSQGVVPVRYLGTAGLYTMLYVVLALSVAIWMFENRELSGDGNG